jgi:hypothetical protein
MDVQTATAAVMRLIVADRDAGKIPPTVAGWDALAWFGIGQAGYLTQARWPHDIADPETDSLIAAVNEAMIPLGTVTTVLYDTDEPEAMTLIDVPTARYRPGLPAEEARAITTDPDGPYLGMPTCASCGRTAEPRATGPGIDGYEDGQPVLALPNHERAPHRWVHISTCLSNI